MPKDLRKVSRALLSVSDKTGLVEFAAGLHTLGIAGDRHWAVRSEEIGGIRGAKKLGGLMLFAAEFAKGTGNADGMGVEITLPDGSTVHSDDADVDVRISAALGHRVTLESLPTDGNLEQIGRAHV